MPREACRVTETSPAKINLTLAVTGRRSDGFHDLHSIVAQTEFGDQIEVIWEPDGGAADGFELLEGELPGGDNSLLQAARLFREVTGLGSGSLCLRLWKRIPLGAGLGGGSSNAAATLRALGRIFPDEAAGHDWARLSAGIGSDCPLFFCTEPVLMQGRGELIEPLPSELADRLSGRPVLLFKPGFSISTPEAYRRLAAASLYTPLAKAESLLTAWASTGSALPDPCNDFERLARRWMPSLGLVLDRLRERAGLDTRLSGSGSACFAFAESGSFDTTLIGDELKSAWGPRHWLTSTRLK